MGVAPRLVREGVEDAVGPAIELHRVPLERRRLVLDDGQARAEKTLHLLLLARLGDQLDQEPELHLACTRHRKSPEGASAAPRTDTARRRRCRIETLQPLPRFPRRARPSTGAQPPTSFQSVAAVRSPGPM